GHGVGIAFDRLFDAGRIEVGVPAVQAQDRAHFAPVLERIRHVGISIDADAEGQAVMLDGRGFDGFHDGYSSWPSSLRLSNSSWRAESVCRKTSCFSQSWAAARSWKPSLNGPHSCITSPR